MAGRLGWFLKEVWVKECGLTLSFTIGAMTPRLPSLSLYTKYVDMINPGTPYNCSGSNNMPDILSHSQDPQGPSL
uniref:NADH dehydrogenase [ubiquinone] 1 alpha subcomplex subunit 3 n=1 Tax=Sarcophilus harrisii TaxID=9305 RepID=A0A7N4V5Y4_SARHA